jgi:hypothetical protein
MAGRVSLKQIGASGAVAGQVPAWNAASSQWKPQLLVPPNLATASSETVSSTASAVFQVKLQLVTSSLPVGTYFATWYAEFSQSNNNGSGEVQALVDGVVVGDYSTRFGLASAFAPMSGFFLIVAGAVSAHTILIQYRSPAGSGTVSIQRVRIALWQVA